MTPKSYKETLSLSLASLPISRWIKLSGLVVLLLLFRQTGYSQAANNTCGTATTLTVGGTCTGTGGDLYLANTTNPTGGCGSRADVWYKFTVPANSTFVTINVWLTSNPSTLTTSNTFIELFNTSNCTVNGTSTGGCNNISSARTYTGLTAGGTYYFRIYTTLTPNTNASRWGFSVCVTSNDECSQATTITPGGTVDGCLYGASATAGVPAGCSIGNPDDDVWYKFTANETFATITMSNLGSNLYSSGPRMQLFSGTCGSLTSLFCGGGVLNVPSGTLTVGQTYYVRAYTHGTGQSGFSQAGGSFKISVTPSAPTVVSAGRMKEVYQQTTLSSVNTLDNPWEVTYGPDGKLWITESKGYRLYRMDPVTGARDTILDVSQGSTFLPLADQTFNMTYNIGANNPQGGFAGLALHPKLMAAVGAVNYVYVSYVYSYQSNTDPNGIFYTNRLVRFTYNTGTGKLESPVSLCDTLPGSNDHNSQRMIIAPVGSTYYLFYAGGDMGAGQFSNRLRPQKAQNPASYEGKILRFNLETDGDGGTLDQWIPNDNPYNATLGVQSAVWSIGIRNNQGFAYDSILNILYGSSHGPYSDDEINIIQQGKNYGHPYVIGYSADNNYNNSTAGAPLTTASGVSSCPMILDEKHNADSLGVNYKDPLFSAYAAPQATVNNIWNTNPNNGGWPSEGWSGLDLYTHTLVPGWYKSLVAASLKWGRLVRMRLYNTGDSVVKTGSTDTISYFGSTNRFRDLAINPDGKDFYVIMDKSATTSGPSAANPVIPACGGCVQKYTFLGYADVAGTSSIPDEISVTAGTVNSCATGTTVTINATNSNYWVPITGPDGNIMAEIFANGQTLGTVTSSFYVHNGSIRRKGNARYLNRNITITPQFQPSSPVLVRFYLTKGEYDLLDADPMSQITAIADLKIHKNSDPCSATISGVTTLINPSVATTFNSNNAYVLQASIPSFSSFYFAAANLTLPLTLVTFTGTYKDNASHLNWETSQEVNTDRFVVERSIDNTNFETIGEVKAKGSSTQKTGYAFIDDKASTLGVAYISYRLKMYDRNGEFTYSNIVRISVPDILVTIVNIYPNPAPEETVLSLLSPRDQRVHWQLIDNAGRVIINQWQNIRRGENKLTIDLRKIPSGAYFVKVKGAFVDTIQKLQKQ